MKFRGRQEVAAVLGRRSSVSWLKVFQTLHFQDAHDQVVERTEVVGVGGVLHPPYQREKVRVIVLLADQSSDVSLAGAPGENLGRHVRFQQDVDVRENRCHHFSLQTRSATASADLVAICAATLQSVTPALHC